LFFPEKIKLIRNSDKVLEIGPGSTPHKRSNAFLELKFDTPADKVAQRGDVATEPNYNNRPVYYYDNNEFPFKDCQFDYVICSHVVEHVQNPTFFINEIFRVGSGRGYLEYPLAPYDYLYDFDVHLQFIKFDRQSNKMFYLPKEDTPLEYFSSITDFLRMTLSNGWKDVVSGNQDYFFEGFEFTQPFEVIKGQSLDMFIPPLAEMRRKGIVRRKLESIMNRFGLGLR